MGPLSHRQFLSLMADFYFQRLRAVGFDSALENERSRPCSVEFIILVKSASEDRGVWRRFSYDRVDSIVRILISWTIFGYISNWAIIQPNGTVIRPKDV